MGEAEASAGPEAEPAEAPSDQHNDLYGAAYYEGYATLRVDGSGTAPVAYRWGEPVWEEFFGNVAREVVARLHPSTALDAGCAIGFLVKSLRERGVDAEGLDISSWAITQVPPDTRPYCRQGLVTDELPHDYDVITCIEVLEHLAPAQAEAAVGNLCRHGQLVLFSSTPVHFDEVTHINVRPPDYWAGLFARHGFYRDFDFDGGFISPDAVLFRPVSHLGQVIRAYERRLWDSQRELRGLQAHREHLHAELQRRLGDRDQASAELRTLLNTKTFRLSAGIRSLWARARGNRQPTHTRARSTPVAANSYQDWVRAFDTLSEEDRKRLGAKISDLTQRPTFSILMPVFNPEAGHLRQAIESVLDQTYPDWELCIADDASTAGHVRSLLEEYRQRDGRIRVVYRPTNGHIVDASTSALELAQGEFVALLDHDDGLASHALACLALELARQPTAAIFYSDEDKIDEQGRRVEPYFKSNWNDELFLGQNYLSHLGAFRRELVLAVGGFRRGFEGSQDYDLSLRVRELSSPEDIRHIPLVLYHRRAHRDSTASSDQAKPHARTASRRAVGDHLARSGRAGEVGSVLGGSVIQVHWAIPNPVPRVKIFVAGTDLAAQEHSIVVLQRLTDYPDYQIERTAGLWPFFAAEDLPRAEAEVEADLPARGRPGAYGAEEVSSLPADASMICALATGVEVIDSSWLRELVAQLSGPGVGLVGARLERYDGALTMGPLVLTDEGRPLAPLDGLDQFEYGYFGRPWLVHSVAALPPGCLLIRRSVLEEVGGADPNLDDLWRAVDLSLRVREGGYRVLWVPSARLRVGPGSAVPPPASPVPPELLERYARLVRSDPAYSPNLSIEAGQEFKPAWPPRQRPPWAPDGPEPS